MKKIVLVPDGAADNPIDSLGGKTPLEFANTPFMDMCAQKGRVGQVQHIAEGLPSGSDVGNLSLLGYNVKDSYPGRAPFEAASLGVPQQKKDLVFRCNFVTVEKDQIIDFSAGHISTSEATQLIQTLQNELSKEGISFFTGLSYRHILLVNEKYAPDCQGLITPPHDLMGKSYLKALASLPDNNLAASLINRSKHILENHPVNQQRIAKGQQPANMIWLWGQGLKPSFQSFEERYGYSAGMISAVDLLKGIAVTLDMEIIDVPGITGYFDTDYSAKMSYALQYLEHKDCIFIHVESPDEAGHAGLVDEKVRALEEIDTKIVGPLISALEEKSQTFRLLISPDHPTPVALKTHTHDLVPFCVYGEGIVPNSISSYSEKESQLDDADIYLDGSKLMQSFYKGDILQ